MSKQVHSEGLRMARLLMVLSSMSPLFVLWAIRGNRLVLDRYFLTFCAAMVVIPYSALWLRIVTARRVGERREVVVGSAEDHRDHLLVYLFAMLLPFYAVDLATWRDVAAVLVGLGFIIFLFWHLNLHYMNVLFAVLGYRVFTISPPADDNPLSGKSPLVLITKRAAISRGEHLAVYRLSDTVYIEAIE
jgi:hypothetical protein